MKRPEYDPRFWLGMLLAVFVVVASGCPSLFVPENKRLTDTIADTQSEVAATDALYLFRCVLGPGAPPLPPGKTAADVLPTAIAPAGFVAPAACMDLHFARVSAEAHIAAAVQVAPNGSAAPELRRKLKVDIEAMRTSDEKVRAAK